MTTLEAERPSTAAATRWVYALAAAPPTATRP
jgi:hypothetical protein